LIWVGSDHINIIVSKKMSLSIESKLGKIAALYSLGIHRYYLWARPMMLPLLVYNSIIYVILISILDSSWKEAS